MANAYVIHMLFDTDNIVTLIGNFCVLTALMELAIMYNCNSFCRCIAADFNGWFIAWCGYVKGIVLGWTTDYICGVSEFVNI